MSKTPLIISTDPGIDDAIAITLAIFSKKYDVKLIAATWGNVSLDKTLNNALRLEVFLKTNVPVVSGAKLPLLKKPIDASDVHGKSGMDGYDFPEPNKNLLIKGLAAEAIHDIVEKSNQKVALMQIGPATDFAMYFRQFPDDLKKIKELVIMGGAIGRGNYGPYDEYNVSGDPEAAKIVFDSNIDIKVAPLELGHQARITPEVMEKIKKINEVGNMFYSILSNLHEGNGSLDHEIYDTLAIAILIKPEMFTFKKAYVAVDTQSPYTYGASVMDFDNFFHKPINAEIGIKVDNHEFVDWFINAIKQIDIKEN